MFTGGDIRDLSGQRGPAFSPTSLGFKGESGGRAGSVGVTQLSEDRVRVCASHHFPFSLLCLFCFFPYHLSLEA